MAARIPDVSPSPERNKFLYDVIDVVRVSAQQYQITLLRALLYLKMSSMSCGRSFCGLSQSASKYFSQFLAQGRP